MEDAQAKAPPELKALAQFLRTTKSGIKLKTGVLGGKRVDYFKGKSAIKALRSPAFAKLKSTVTVESDEQAQDVMSKLNQHAFFLRIARGPPSSGSGSPKHVQIIPEQLFAPEEFYVWLIDANQTTQLLLAFAMVVCVLAAVMFPLWPTKMRVGVWYLSIAVLGLIGVFFGMAIVRLIVWLVTVVAVRPGIWIFPNLFADVGFVESFIPLWSWDVPPPKKSKKEKSSSRKKSDKNSSGASDGAGKSKKNKSEPADLASGAPKIVEIQDDEQ
ncbi:Translocation protein S62 [Microbotryomycetes sp. JL201]|nr:Translocation protein S62 [Microbotryomycetes sp. JL201]